MQVRDSQTGFRTDCKQVIIGTKNTPCPKRSEHITVLKTGQCDAGWCEGKEPLDCKGEPAPCCKLWLTCPCSCHDLVSRMFAIAEQPRQRLDNPKYMGPKLKFYMPSRADVLRERAEKTHERITIVESPDPESIPVSVVKDYTPTTSGRSGRGQLEQQVKEACDSYVQLGDPGIECTTLWVAEWICREHKVLPSRGAIDAVWKRWVECGAAFTMHKPTRFIAYTPDAIRLGIEELKARSKKK